MTQLVTGHNEDFLDGLKHRRVRFAIVPAAFESGVGPADDKDKDGKAAAERAKEREKRIGAFQKLLASIVKTELEIDYVRPRDFAADLLNLSLRV